MTSGQQPFQQFRQRVPIVSFSFLHLRVGGCHPWTPSTAPEGATAPRTPCTDASGARWVRQFLGMGVGL
eukprot:9938765-Alexandrium_andersonii.AAC.1